MCPPPTKWDIFVIVLGATVAICWFASLIHKILIDV